mmetsp:Transcript_23472/g.54755  ORF Transcript_23472/g.54755 Transcript_23472/m.54755 type:complete len:240 (+) Transcript_23472:41-760(+)
MAPTSHVDNKDGPVATRSDGNGLLRVPTSQPRLPSVASTSPLRRVASLSSVERVSAIRQWEQTLKDRLGTPGPPLAADALPGLALRRSGLSALRPDSGSAPPSTLGPSASIVAWFAQFRCTRCNQIPYVLDARFCAFCGEALPIPGNMLPAERPAVKTSLDDCPVPMATRTGGRGARPRQGQHVDGGGGYAHARTANHNRGPSERRRGGAVRGQRDELPWAAKESQVAVWLGNIKPRRH